MLKVNMDLELIVLYLYKKDLVSVEIHTEINHVHGEGTVGYLTVTRYLCKKSFADSSTLPREESEIQGPGAINKTIPQRPDEQAFASLRETAKRILVPMSIL
jgi:hypothetical protein